MEKESERGWVKEPLVKFDSFDSKLCTSPNSRFNLNSIFLFRNHRNQINHTHFRLHLPNCSLFICISFLLLNRLLGLLCSKLVGVCVSQLEWNGMNTKAKANAHSNRMRKRTKISNLWKCTFRERKKEGKWRAFGNISSRLIFSIIITTINNRRRSRRKMLSRIQWPVPGVYASCRVERVQIECYIGFTLTKQILLFVACSQSARARRPMVANEKWIQKLTVVRGSTVVCTASAADGAVNLIFQNSSRMPYVTVTCTTAINWK